MDRTVLAGIAIGATAGGTLRVVLGSNWFLIAAVVAIYAGWAYFAVRYRRLLWSEFPAFDRSVDRLGYAIGLFGVTVGSLAFGQRYAAGGASIEFLVGYLGVIGFLHTSSSASADADSD
ncbi:hypothetical protein JMJ58_11075 [Haloterrigena salifodinae]|uniref:Uncharacterized protein n=1 Tax=Haloterrigena salifodinae TaxID=2675099 RepID=A0A8T8DW95_9EURY|nr:hypothetical protein [Haloterrigena salifodinae]QRV13511.1 hypothetical protein JMJ58_11075 [Haloterrigena salifodinae]